MRFLNSKYVHKIELVELIGQLVLGRIDCIRHVSAVRRMGMATRWGYPANRIVRKKPESKLRNITGFDSLTHHKRQGYLLLMIEGASAFSTMGVRSRFHAASTRHNI